ncbi:thioredoxin family protein [Flavivirga rizhaonensis]|uniref:Thioredoxin family protein n=1 Tax=Flavivirga rizhaonensis TaxID=2559571 RepID=A0A4S1DRB8_9FLAO|nr:thioredoxin family protein [Flavivirga rizhaonensis]TGV00480.1 thioredoxin family protein [Flavivirga rizhaonensis]
MKYLLYILLLTSQLGWTQLKNYTFKELSLLKEERPIVIFLHTDWCKYCKVMENTTFKNEKIIEKLNERFYFISFNAEQKTSVTFKNHTFKYKSTGKKTGIHELAEALGTVESKISYPTTVVLNNKKEIVFQYPYLLKPKEFLKVLNKIE